MKRLSPNKDSFFFFYERSKCKWIFLQTEEFIDDRLKEQFKKDFIKGIQNLDGASIDICIDSITMYGKRSRYYTFSGTLYKED